MIVFTEHKFVVIILLAMNDEMNDEMNIDTNDGEQIMLTLWNPIWVTPPDASIWLPPIFVLRMMTCLLVQWLAMIPHHLIPL